MSATVEIVFNAVDNASNVIMNGIGEAFAFLADQIQESLNSASESEQALTGLEAVLASSGQSAHFTAEGLSEMATALQNVTRYTDEEIIAAETMILRFENINSDIFPQTIELATDLAASLGIDLTTAARLLGMALDNPAEGIGRLNTQLRLFTDAELEAIQAMAAAGDVAGAQALIMERLAEKVGGAAAAFGDTFAGQIDIAMNRLDNLRELIGGPIMFVLEDLLQWFNDEVFTSIENSPFIRFLELVNEYMGNGAPLWHSLALALARVVQEGDLAAPILIVLRDTFAAIHFALAAGEGPLAAFIAGLTALAADSGPLGTLADILLDVFDSDTPLEGIDTFVARIFDAIADAITEWTNNGGASALSNRALMWLETLGTGPEAHSRALAAAGHILLAIGDAFASVEWAAIGEALDEALARVIESHDWMASGTAFGDEIERILSIGIDEGLEGVESDAISAIGEALGNWFLGAAGVASWEEFEHTFMAILDEFVLRPMQNAFEENWRVIFLGFFGTTEWRELGRNMIAGLVEGLNSVEIDMTNWVRDHIVEPIKDFLGINSPSTVFRDIGINIIAGLLQGLAVMATSVSVFALMIGNRIVSGIISGITSLWNALVDIVTDILGLFAPILDALGIVVNTDTGGIGSGSGDSGTGESGGGNTVTNTYNFYGTTYVYGIGPEGEYDCAEDPVITATANQLVANGLA